MCWPSTAAGPDRVAIIPTLSFSCACAAPPSRASAAVARNMRFMSISRSRAISTARRCLLHRAVLGMGIGVGGKHLLVDFGLELAVLPLGHLDEIEILDRI